MSKAHAHAHAHAHMWGWWLFAALWFERCWRKGWLARHEDERSVYLVLPRYAVARDDGVPADGWERMTAGEARVTRQTRFSLTRVDGKE